MIYHHGEVIAEVRCQEESKLVQKFFEDKQELDSFILNCYQKKIDFQIIWKRGTT